MAPHLERRRGLRADEALRAARISGGRFGAAMTLDLTATDEIRAALFQAIGRLAQDRPRDHVLEDIELFGAQTPEIVRSLDILEGIVRDMLILAAGGRPDTLINADHIEELASLAGRLDRGAAGEGPDERLLRAADRIDLARQDLERNVNRKLLLETLLFDIGRPPGCARRGP
jgi:hypothetical protein